MYMNVLYVLSPSDRMNYGDLLFSHIIKHYFSSHFSKTIFCSTKGANLSRYGAIKTCSYKTLFKASASANNYLIVSGGDCLFINWPMIISFIDKPSSFIEAISHKLNINIYDKYITVRYGIKTKYPFTIGKNELSNFKGVLYNSLGGSFIESCPNIVKTQDNKKILSNVDYLSTRDYNANQILVANGLKSHCVPDSAILLSEIFKEDLIKLKVSPNNKSLLSERHIFFQINFRLLGDNVDFYAKLIDIISEAFSISVILCPIGTAPGHSDDKALKLIKRASSSSRIHLISSPTIWDIMHLINSASLYIGTSLHGAITALSYKTPLIGFGAKKLIEYMRYWHPEAVVCQDKTTLKEAIEKQLTSPIIPNIKRSKGLVLDSFNNMLEVINL